MNVPFKTVASTAQTISAESLSMDLRRVMRHVGSTVTIITTENGKPFGMVATAMMSLSLEPPALAIAINRSASICEPLLKRQAFCVNVLSRHDDDISRRFTKLSGAGRFSAGTWSVGESGTFRGIPFLTTAQAALFCTVQQSMDSGTHSLIVGSIIRATDNGVDDPLLYCDGAYGKFAKSGQSTPIALDDRLSLCKS